MFFSIGNDIQLSYAMFGILLLYLVEGKGLLYLVLLSSICNLINLKTTCYSLLATFSDSVDLKDGLLNNRVCTVNFLVVDSYFSCNTTNTLYSEVPISRFLFLM